MVKMIRVLCASPNFMETVLVTRRNLQLMIRRNAELQLEAVRQLRHGSFDSMPSFDEGTGTPHFSPLVRPSAPLPSDFTLTDAFALPPQDDTVALEVSNDVPVTECRLHPGIFPCFQTAMRTCFWRMCTFLLFPRVLRTLCNLP